jgi:hypothetical protein
MIGYDPHYSLTGYSRFVFGKKEHDPGNSQHRLDGEIHKYHEKESRTL